MESVDYPLIILLVGLLVMMSLLVKLALERIGLPSLVGFLAIGYLLRIINDHFALLSIGGHEILSFLADVGLATLLFRIGLESNLAGLIRQLPKASLIWIGDVVISGFAGYAAATYLLDQPLTTALFVAAALSATSVGISVGAWQSSSALDSPQGEFLLDVAELDDISAVLLMALLFSLLPEMQQGHSGNMSHLALMTTLVFLGKFLAFVFFCLLFSRYVEKPLTHFFASHKTAPEPMLAIVGVGFIFAALAGLIGFSIAIGAFLIGLVFSRDPEAVKMEGSFQPIYQLFSPFFFIGIGFDLDPTGLGEAAWAGSVLLAVAIAGKLIADGLPVFFLQGWQAALLIGVSMVPRAEIAMVIMSRGRELGDWAVPDHIYSAVVLVSAVTCVAAPLAVRPLVERWPPMANQEKATPP